MDHDLVLQALIEANFNIELTLCVLGVIVHGTLVAEDEYYDALGKYLDKESETLNAKNPRMSWAKSLGNRILQEQAELKSEFRESTMMTSFPKYLNSHHPSKTFSSSPEGIENLHAFIHLKDVQVVTPTGLLARKLWRCRTKDISGFSFGEQIP